MTCFLISLIFSILKIPDEAWIVDVPQDQNFKEWFISEYQLVNIKSLYDGVGYWVDNPKSNIQGFKSARLAPRPLG